jgi:hypothetical protein
MSLSSSAAPARRSSMRAIVGIRRRLEPERRGVGGQGVEVLGPADPAAGLAAHLEQPDLAHALEVGAHGVDVQVERLGDLGGGRGAGERASSR